MGQGTKTQRHGSTPLRILTALAAVAAGVVLILTPLSARETAIVTGVGLVFTGVAILLHDGRSDRAGKFPRAVAVTVIVFGAVVALVPAEGAPWIAFLIGAGLIVHGLRSVIRAVRVGSPYRAAEIIAACAGIVFGSVLFIWPVLTLSIFRLAIGTWFVFFGLRLLVDLILRHGARKPIIAKPVTRGRQWVRTIGAALSLVLAIALAVGSGAVLGGAPLPEPGRFYTAPTEVPDGPGQLIRSEPLSTGVPAGARAWRILYTTTHPDGSPAISSGTVIAPAAPGGSPAPLLTVAHGTTGVVPKCAPSMSSTPFADGAGAALAEMVTQHGWVAVTSDYIGLGTDGTHPYLVGDAEARNVLDASRAVQELTGVSTTSDTVVWGHSQGGQGSLWTGQVAKDYAPELTVRGIAAFAPAADLYGLAEADKNDPAGKTVSAYIASTWDRIYPEFELEQQLTPGSAGAVERIHDLCFNGKDVIGALLSGTQIPNQVFPDSLLAGAFGDELKAQTPIGPFPAPVMVAQGLADPLVKPDMQHDWVEGRCEAGVPIDYRTFPGLSHVSLVAADSPLTPQLVSWTLDRWAGEPPTPNCDHLPK